MLSFFSDIFHSFIVHYYTCKDKIINIFFPIEFHYGCPNSKRIQKLNVKRTSYK